MLKKLLFFLVAIFVLLLLSAVLIVGSGELARQAAPSEQAMQRPMTEAQSENFNNAGEYDADEYDSSEYYAGEYESVPQEEQEANFNDTNGYESMSGFNGTNNYEAMSAAAEPNETPNLEPPPQNNETAQATRPHNKIALTFDDGPSAYTGRILNLLERHGGRATFFVSAPRMLARSDTVIRAFNMGNQIANHTWNHQNLTLLTEEEILHEIQSSSDAIRSVVGISPPLLRPPFGMSDERVVRICAELGYGIVKWTVDPLDWRYRDPDIVYRSIMDQVEAGSIILTHDTRPTTATAMERVIPRLLAEGFELVTVSELLYFLYGGIQPGRIYGTYTILD